MYMFTMMMTDALEDEAAAKDSKNVKIWIVVCYSIDDRSWGAIALLRNLVFAIDIYVPAPKSLLFLVYNAYTCINRLSSLFFSFV